MKQLRQQLKYVCLLTLMLLAGASGIKADEVQYLTLTVNGQPVRFALSDHPVITFENNQLVVTTTAETVSMPVAEISVGGFTDNADGLYRLEAAPKGVVGGQVHFSNLPAKAVVTVYTLDGRKVMQQASQPDGTVNINLRGLAKGTYVIKSPTQTFKVSNR